MIRVLRWLVPIVFCICAIPLVSSQEGKKYSIKSTTTPAPKEVSDPIRKLLADSSIKLLDADGKAICDVWFRKEMPADAAPEQLKTGVTFREVKQSEILAAIQFHHDGTDYRKQPIKAGVYTLRLGYQPSGDGKHTTELSEFQDFAVATFARDDTKPTLLEFKELVERSRESLELPHPGVFMLWPNTKPGKEPELAAKPKNHWVLNSKYSLIVGNKLTGTDLGIGLTLVGQTPADLR